MIIKYKKDGYIDSNHIQRVYVSDGKTILDLLGPSWQDVDESLDEMIKILGWDKDVIELKRSKT